MYSSQHALDLAELQSCETIYAVLFFSGNFFFRGPESARRSERGDFGH